MGLTKLIDCDFVFYIALSDVQLREFKKTGEIVVKGFTLTTEDIRVGQIIFGVCLIQRCICVFVVVICCG